MTFLQKIQKKPHAEKIRLIWAIVIVVCILLIMVWVATSQISKKYFGGKGLFHNMNSEFSDEQKFYQQDLKDKGVDVPDRLHLVR